MQFIKNLFTKTVEPVKLIPAQDVKFQEVNDLQAYFKFWKEITANRAVLSSHYFLLHDLILGRDPKKSGFSPITNKNKLANGHQRWHGLANSISYVRWGSLNNDPLARQLLALAGKTSEWAAKEVEKINLKD